LEKKYETQMNECIS